MTIAVDLGRKATNKDTCIASARGAVNEMDVSFIKFTTLL